MAVPVLNTYQYQYMETGVLLNGSTSLPFIDVKKVSGLDMPEIDVISMEYDSQHGGYVESKYVGMRTIVIDGLLYASPETADVTIDALITNFIPDGSDYPFFFKGAGIAQRYILCKPVGFNHDVDSLRSYGACAVQFQLKAGDVRKYVDNADVTMVNNTNVNAPNLGNINSYPIFTITGAMTAISLTNNTTAKTLTLTTTRIAGDVVVVDFYNKSITINGVRNSSVATGTWWDIAKNSTPTIKYVVTGGPPTSVVVKTKQAWL